MLELKDRLPKAIAGGGRRRQAGAEDELRDDLLSALLNLGYHRPRIEKALDKVAEAADAPRTSSSSCARRSRMTAMNDDA